MTHTEIQAEIIAKHEFLHSIICDNVQIPSFLRQLVNKKEIELIELKQQLAECDQCEHILEKVKEAWTPDKRTFEEAEAESKGQAWICPRCQKVHNWMVQSCDCPANVITASTTEPIKELAEISGMASCNSCRHQDTCNIDSDNVCKWEPKTKEDENK
jgi:hypothetical protein